ncbi:nicotinamidase/pyrazinamidase [Legionella massiliensis]|uniref:nicotinamidase n=1 Tax=Legionella massiliensis TaxID=1034943 RepID=A0A078KT15_9GAMM|nr:bifunctional nicotinamidase/pyrazinamidase [Legionella massiliensis]CDZ77585.1 nicotinamidase/pyrazinamidase [Legionella massiliensis]CEE13323.1 nicotinamidase/pyrazinamidase [Legionella massiliensis]
MNVLIIIDVQNDFMPGGSLAVPQADRIVPIINQIQEKFDLVVATQDWHPANHQSFASNNPGKNVFEIIDLQGVEQTLWPDHCVQGTVGAEFHPMLDLRSVGAIFRKGMAPETDSYSCFYDNARKKSTGLLGYLREKKATRLYFCGLCSDICVYYSIKDALDEGFSCVLLEDAACPLDEEKYQMIREELLGREVVILVMGEL